MMSQKIAIDAGHGYVKALSQSGQRYRFPSLICSMPPNVDLGGLGKQESVTIDGVRYLIGEPARAHATPLWSHEKSTDSDTLRLILVAAVHLGGVGPVTLATGLPLAWFGSQRRAFREALTGFGSTVQLPGQPPQRLWFESVTVLPQGVAAAASVLSSAEYEPGSYLIVDIGYRTTDYIVVVKSEDGGLDYEPGAAGSLEMGMHNVSQPVVHAVNDQYQVAYSASEVEVRATVVVRGQKIDVSQRMRDARQTVGRRLAQELAATMGPQLDKLMGIVAVGGGADILSPVLPGIMVPADPQWGNVIGYQMMLE